MSEGDAQRPWETRNAGPSSERTRERADERQLPRPEERSMHPYRREVIDLTSVGRNAQPSDPAHAFTTAGPFVPYHPFRLPSHGYSNGTHLEPRGTIRPQAAEQHEAGPSNQQPSLSRNEETGARGGRRAEMSLSRIMCSEVRPTLQCSGSQTQLLGDSSTGPSGHNRSTVPDLSGFAQSALDLDRETPRVDSSSKDVSKAPNRNVKRYVTNVYRSMNNPRLLNTRVDSSRLSTFPAPDYAGCVCKSRCVDFVRQIWEEYVVDQIVQVAKLNLVTYFFSGHLIPLQRESDCVVFGFQPQASQALSRPSFATLCFDSGERQR